MHKNIMFINLTLLFTGYLRRHSRRHLREALAEALAKALAEALAEALAALDPPIPGTP